MTDSEKFVVIRWDHFSPFSERVVFEGSFEECRIKNKSILDNCSQNIDAMVLRKSEFEKLGSLA